MTTATGSLVIIFRWINGLITATGITGKHHGSPYCVSGHSIVKTPAYWTLGSLLLTGALGRALVIGSAG